MEVKGFSSLIRSLSGFAFCKDLNLQYTDCNSKFSEMTGFSTIQNCLGKGDLDVTTFTMAENFSGVMQADQTVIASGEPILGLVEAHEYCDGTMRLVTTNKYPLLNAHNEVVGVFGICVPYQGHNYTELLKSLHQRSLSVGLNNKQSRYELLTAHGVRYLTHREIECLVQLLQGRTAKAIGLVLGITHRTVTTHLNNVKQKLNCCFKSDLIEYLTKQTNFLQIVA